MTTYTFSKMTANLRRSEIRELLKLTRRPEIISFAGGLPDPSLFPYDEVAESAERAIRERGDLALQYSPTEGDPFLKEQLVKFMNSQGENVRPENLLIVSSSQQGLDLLSKVFIDPGSPIIVEMPSYVGSLQIFRFFSADFHGIRMDADGVIFEDLEREVKALCAEGRKPRFIYVIPDFQNPSGITMSMERHEKLLKLAHDHDLLIVEDAPYRELRYAGKMLPSLYSMDKENRVVCLKTFSKIFVPGFRIGWVLAPVEIIDKFVMAKQGTDLCTAAFNSITAAYYISMGHLNHLIERAKKLYAQKGKIMLDALEKYMPKDSDIWWSKPEGGMFLWVKLPEYMDAKELFMQAVEQNVAYVIGSAFHWDGSGKNTLRLNYSFPSIDQIDKGVQRLAEVVKKNLRAKVA